jgi:hypothetical protein
MTPKQAAYNNKNTGTLFIVSTYAIIQVSTRLIDFIVVNLFNNGFQSEFLNFKNKVLADKKVIRIANQICIAL